MWTATLDLDLKRVLLTRLLGRFYPGAYVASFSPLQVQNVPREALPANNWVRVRNRLAGICGSDLHLVCADGDFRIAPAAISARKPTYLGHEVVGEVIEIGDDVQHLRVGDRVVLQSGPNCVSAGVEPLCRFCSTGNYNLCENGFLPGREPIGAGWSEEMLLHEQQLFSIPAEISDEQAVMIEPTAVALHTVLRHPPQSHDRVLIIGAGTIGLLTLQIVQLLAPNTEISILARHAFQVEQATRMGAAHIIYPQDAYNGVQQATHARLYRGMLGNHMLLGGYDVIYDTVGSSRTLHNALRWIRAQGTIVHAGISLHFMNLDLSPIWYQEVNLLGATSHGIETWPLDNGTQRSTFSIVTELLERGRIHPEQLITHHFALNDYKQAITTTISKSRSRAIKVVFDHSLLPVSVVPNVRASARQPRPGIVDTNGRRKTRDVEAIELPVTPTPHTVIPETPAGPERTLQEEPIPTTPTAADEPDDWNEVTETAIPIIKFPPVPRPLPTVESQHISTADAHDVAPAPFMQNTIDTPEPAAQPLPSVETREAEDARSPYEFAPLPLDPYLSEQPTEGIPLSDIHAQSASERADAAETHEATQSANAWTGPIPDISAMDEHRAETADTTAFQEAAPSGEPALESSEHAQPFISFEMETDRADTTMPPPIQYFPDPAESIDIIQSALGSVETVEETRVPDEPPAEPAIADQEVIIEPVEAVPSHDELTETTVTKETNETLNIEEPPVAQKRPRAPRKRKKTTESLRQPTGDGE